MTITMTPEDFSIKTENLLLRDFNPADFQAFFRITQDPEYQQYYPESETTLPFFQDLFTNILSFSERPDRKKYQLAVCLQSGELIGTCGIRIEDSVNEQASFGCAFARDYWGKAYAYEASRAIINHAFISLPVHRIYAESNSDNWRAKKLTERLGMRLEALLKETKLFRGRWWDTAVYGLLKDDWKE